MAFVRVLHAAADETVEIVWTRRVLRTGPGVPSRLETQELRERHTAPPEATWEARREVERQHREGGAEHEGD